MYCWGNLGHIEDMLYRFEEAEFCYRKGLELAKNDQERGFIYLNYAGLLVNMGDWHRARDVAEEALALRPDKAKAKGNLGMALLALGRWKDAWSLYDAIIGFDKSRRKMQYRDEPVWDGGKDQAVVVYEEQGIGDAISFASMLPDVIRDSKKVIVDCSPKLEGLFRRSFPQAIVYGSATGRGEDWRPKHKFDASVSIGGLGKHYRPTPESCPGTPYLIADPERVRMWKALFAEYKKPVIGIAWSGGVEHTGARFRTIALEQLQPLFQAVDAHWVSLQYKDAQAEIDAFRGAKVRQYRFGTLTPDYDDTAAMVAALDLTVAMPTSVVHLAGALGAPCIAMKAPHSCWKFTAGLPFHRTNMQLVDHAGSWDETIRNTAELVRARFSA